MSQIPRGRPAKSDEQKRKNKSTADRRRYLEKKVKTGIAGTAPSITVDSNVSEIESGIHLAGSFTRARVSSVSDLFHILHVQCVCY